MTEVNKIDQEIKKQILNPSTAEGVRYFNSILDNCSQEDDFINLSCLCEVSLLLNTANQIACLSGNTESSKMTKEPINWKTYFKGSIPKMMESKPAQKSIWSSGKGPLIMEYYTEHKDHKALSNISEELKKKFNFNCARNTIRSFILGVLDDTKNMYEIGTKNGSVSDSFISNLSDEGIQDINWREYFTGEMPASIKGKPKQEDIWEDGTGLKLMSYYSKNIEKDTFTKISKDLYNRHKYSLSTIKRFIENVLKDVADKRNAKNEGLIDGRAKRKVEENEYIYKKDIKRRKLEDGVKGCQINMKSIEDICVQ